MSPTTSLVIIYNHYHPQNIDRLNEIYLSRFAEVLHLVPFIESHGDSVISVGRSSHNFQGYIFDAKETLQLSQSDRFLFIADDVLLNPAINWTNVDDKFGLTSEDDAFLENISALSSLRSFWRHTASALSFRVKSQALSISHVLPPLHEAVTKIGRLGDASMILSPRAVHPNLLAFIYSTTTGPIRKLDGLVRRLLGILGHDDWRVRLSRKTDYPFAWGYSDVFILPKSALPRFSQLCGAFAAAGLFVEIAVPTALALSCDVVKAQASGLTGQALWGKEKSSLETFNRSLSALVSEFPETTLFLHPVKLSEWS